MVRDLVTVNRHAHAQSHGPRFGMASKDHGHEIKAKWGSVRARVEANDEGKKDMSTANTANESNTSIRNKPTQEKWLFTEDQLENTPSRRDSNNPITSAKELNNRQQTANLIQDMGQRLPVNQLTINTAIVYMHRFYMFHSFQAFYKFHIASTALFLAAKVEEQPRKLEHVIRVCHSCLNPNEPHLDVNSDEYLKQAQRLVQYELIMLQTLGFDISIDHPHTHVVKCTQLVRASRDLSQTAYFLATNSLHLTNFCLKYKPTVVSAMCIHLSCKWSNYEIPLSSTGKAYWTYMDPTITESLLENIINEFLKILSLCPARLRKLKNYKPSARDGGGGSTPQSKDGQQPKHSASKISQSLSQPVQHAAEQRQHVSVINQSEEQKKQPSRLSLAEYNKREKESQSKQFNSQHDTAHNKATTSKIFSKNNAPKVPTAQRSQQHSHSNPKQLHQQRLQTHPDANKPQQISHSGLTKLPTEPNPTNPKEKVHMKSMNHHKRPEKTGFGQSQKIPQAVHSGMPGLQKPKHQTSQFTNQGTSQQPRKEFTKTHSQSHKPHGKIPLPPRPKEVSTLSQPPDERNVRGPVPGGSLDDSVLEGMEQKLNENIKAEKTAKDPPPNKLSEAAVPQKAQTQPTHSNHHSTIQREHKSRQSLPNLSSHVLEPPSGQSQSQHSQQKMYKSLYEHYKKNPESLKQQLKQKALTEPLSDEEKTLLHKIKKKEEERQRKKRKHEKHRLNRSQPVESHDTGEGGNVTPGGGPLTMRIKLPARAKIPQLPTGGLASSSGSGSEAVKSSPSTSHKSGRKRTHGNDSSSVSDAVSAKHSRKSEGHHHQSHHSSHDSSRSRHHRHSRPSSHHSRSQIDDSTFQQALVNAVSMVQSGQTAPGPSGSEKVVPTVTLKRTGTQNGSGENYVAHSSKHKSRRSKHIFDPSTPISATPPDDIFDGDREEYTKPSFSGDTDTGNHAVSKNADLSSPETGEIRDEDESNASPLQEHNTEQLNYFRERKEFHSQGRLNVNSNNNPHPVQRQNPWSVASQVAGTSELYKNRGDITQSDQR